MKGGMKGGIETSKKQPYNNMKINKIELSKKIQVVCKVV
jgi:hypothetical protein